jgi:hypothetical protein
MTLCNNDIITKNDIKVYYKLSKTLQLPYNVFNLLESGLKLHAE